MSSSKRERKANFRFRVIAALICRRFDSVEQERQARKELLAKEWDFPDGTTGRISERTLRWWLSRYRKLGQEGLYDRLNKPRSDKGISRALSPNLLSTAAELKRQVPQRSVKAIIRLLRSQPQFQECQISPSTLRRYLKQLGLPKQASEEQAPYRRWEQEHINDLWQGDTSHGLWLPDPNNPKKAKKTKLIIFVDDASRVCTHAQFYFNEQLPSLLDAFGKALLKRGKPSRLLLDNAYIFHSTALESMASALKIELAFCTERYPEGKGKIERLIRTCKSGFYPEASHAGFTTIEQLNEALFAWIANCYHTDKHDELGMTPLERWQKESERVTPVIPDVLRRALMLRANRKVHINTATIRLDGEEYQASMQLAGQLVEIRWHPDDIDMIEIWVDGKCVENAERITKRPNHVPKRILADEPPSHQTFESSKQFFRELIAKNPKLDCLPTSVISDEFISCQELVHLFVQCFERPLTQRELEQVATQFRRLAPIQKTTAFNALRQAVSIKGSSLHLRYYLQHLEQAVQKGRR